MLRKSKGGIELEQIASVAAVATVKLSTILTIQETCCAVRFLFVERERFLFRLKQRSRRAFYATAVVKVQFFCC